MTSTPGSTGDAAFTTLSRRSLLQTGGATLGAAVLSPVVLGTAGVVGASQLGDAASMKHEDPDELFRLGQFREADWGYRRLLRRNPNNAHAAARRGYIALLSNEFDRAESFLTRAVDLAPEDRHRTGRPGPRRLLPGRRRRDQPR
jgi:predicted Zn-dependent protease